MASFEDAIRDELAGYPWLDGPNAQSLFGVIGAGQDASMGELRDAIRMRDPMRAPEDALPHIARDRRVLRCPTESTDNFRARLASAPDDWYWGGTATGFLTFTFAPYGFTAADLGVYSNDEIAWDSNTDWHSRVFLLLDSSSGYFTTDGLWPEDEGDADPNDVWSEDDAAATWDSSATHGDLTFLRASVHCTKGEYAYPVTIAVWLAGALPDGYWDSPGPVWPESGDASGAVWAEEADCSPLYWTLGHVWGEEAWCGGGPESDAWTEGDEELIDLPESDEWIAFPGEES